LKPFEGLVSSSVVSFQTIFNSYTQAYNKVYKRKGSLFIPNFKRKQVDSDNYFGTLIACIHNNPVHHGFVENPDDWPHSSWYAYLQDKATKIKRKEGMEWFGGRKDFIRVHREIRMEKLLSIFEERFAQPLNRVIPNLFCSLFNRAAKSPNPA
jgi:putative transposase